MRSSTPQLTPNHSTPAGGAPWSEFFHLAWRGIGMGVAEVIPGVSGGTIALITGVLERFIRAIHSVDAHALRLAAGLRVSELLQHVHWRFLLMLFGGQVAGVLLVTRVISLPRLLREYPEPTMALFFGLIVGSILLLSRDGGRPGLKGLGAYLLGATLGLAVVVGVRTETPDAPWFVAVAGAISICAWILPGVSGSFVLLLLRKYDYVWEAVTLANGLPVVHNLLNVIIPFGIGAVVGLALFSRFLSWLMRRWPRRTLNAMTGLLIASLWAIFPFQHPTFEVMASGKEKLVGTSPFLPPLAHLASLQGILALALMVSGFFLVLWLDRQAQGKRRSSPAPEASLPRRQV